MRVGVGKSSTDNVYGMDFYGWDGEKAKMCIG